MNKIRETLSSLNFSRFVIFHPFKGFWELKAEKRGTVPAATSILIALIAVYILRYQFTGFVLNYNEPNEMNVFMQICYVLFPFLVWCIANWSITTLMDGEGSFKDIYIASAFALVPLLIINIPQLVLSQVLVEDEVVVYTLLDSLGVIWAAFLMLIGIMTVHQYSMSRTIATILITVVTMVIILTILLLFFSLLQQVWAFIRLLYFEIFQRK